MTYILKSNRRENSPPPRIESGAGSAGGGGGRGTGRPFFFPPPASRLTPHAAHGFTLVSAIFLMVVLVVLGASLVTLGSVQHTTSAQQLQSVRAYYAARSGAEWAAARIAVPAACAGVFDLGAFRVTVSCTSVSHMLGLTPTAYYVVTSTAVTGNYAGTDYISRQIESKVLQQ